jgi:hypothetical protein
MHTATQNLESGLNADCDRIEVVGSSDATTHACALNFEPHIRLKHCGGDDVRIVSLRLRTEKQFAFCAHLQGPFSHSRHSTVTTVITCHSHSHCHMSLSHHSTASRGAPLRTPKKGAWYTHSQDFQIPQLI